MPPPLRDFESVWRQTRLPDVMREGPTAPLLVKLAFLPDNRSWLRVRFKT